MTESFRAYQEVDKKCQELNVLGNTFCPDALARDSNLVPSTDPLTDIRTALTWMLDIHEILYPNLTHAQHTLIITQYNFVVSLFKYLKNAEFIPVPRPSSPI
jgi:hypothetical protein